MPRGHTILYGTSEMHFPDVRLRRNDLRHARLPGVRQALQAGGKMSYEAGDTITYRTGTMERRAKITGFGSKDGRETFDAELVEDESPLSHRFDSVLCEGDSVWGYITQIE